MQPRRRNNGFTLVEMLLVMAIIGMIAGTVAFTLPSSSARDKSPQDIAVTLKEQLQYAREYAMVRQQPLGLVMDDDGYQFVHWYDNQWQPLNARGLKAVNWDERLRWQLQPLEGNLVAQEEAARDLLFQPDGDNDEQEDEQPQPQILILPSGEMTAFSLALDKPQLARREQRWLIAQSAWQVSIQDEASVDASY